MRTTSRLVAVLFVCACFGPMSSGCSGPAETPATERTAAPAPPQYHTQDVSVVLPAGERQAGRRAFVDLKCTACHRVAGESAFPAPPPGTRGPDLDHALGLRPVSDVAGAIIAPSHSMSVKTSDEVKRRLEETLLSPMGDFSRVMTVRQLADLLAYLTSLDASK